MQVTDITHQGTEVAMHLSIAQPRSGIVKIPVITSPDTMVAIRRQPLPADKLTFAPVDQEGQ